MRHGNHGQFDAHHTPHASRPKTCGIDDVQGVEATFFGDDVPAAIGSLLQVEHAIAQDDIRAALAGGDCERVGRTVGIDVAFVCIEESALQTARVDEWAHLADFFGRDQSRLHLHGLVHGARGFEHLPALLGSGEADTARHVHADVLTAFALDIFVETDGVALQRRDVRIVVERVKTGCGMPGGPCRQFRALDERDVAPAVTSEVIEHAAADDTAADHHDPVVRFHERQPMSCMRYSFRPMEDCMKYIISPPPPVSVAVRDSDGRFPVRRVYCVGRNYEAHAREMGRDPSREAPFIFQKPTDAVVESGSVIEYPPQTNNLHHEIEWVVAIGRGGFNIHPETALQYVFGYAVGLDLTRRDLQFAARDAGRPWEWGKAFDRSAPCSEIVAASTIGHPVRGCIWLSVNGVLRQEADISQLIWSLPEIIAFISSSMILQPGDLIFTGTPSGVGPLVAGDVVAGGVDGIGRIGITIAPTAAR